MILSSQPNSKTESSKALPSIFVTEKLIDTDIQSYPDFSELFLGCVEDIYKKRGKLLFSDYMRKLDDRLETIYDLCTNDNYETDYKKYDKLKDELYGQTEFEVFSTIFRFSGIQLKGFKERHVDTKIPISKRFEHTHILAGSGHGKTQLLQNLISADIQNMLDNRMSVCVIDGQGDLIKKILGMEATYKIKDRVVIVDPSDVENPFCLNPFNLRSQFSGNMTALEILRKNIQCKRPEF